MAGFNANFRNSSTDKDYVLNRDPGHGSAATFQIAPPQQGLNEISCGEAVQDALTETTFKSLFRFDDIIARQRYYSVLFSFRIDEVNPNVLLKVRSTSFRPFITVWRNATHRFEKDPDLSSESEFVVPIDVTADISGPFILEVTSEEPYQTGDFEVELVCDEPESLFARAGVYGDAYAPGPHAVNPPEIWDASFVPPIASYPSYDFYLDGASSIYTFSVLSGDTEGLTLDSDGKIHGTISKLPPWSTLPLDTSTLRAPAFSGWNDSMYFDDWRLHRRLAEDPNPVYQISFTVQVTGAGALAGPHVVSIPIYVWALAVTGDSPIPPTIYATPSGFLSWDWSIGTGPYVNGVSSASPLVGYCRVLAGFADTVGWGAEVRKMVAGGTNILPGWEPSVAIVTWDSYYLIYNKSALTTLDGSLTLNLQYVEAVGTFTVDGVDQGGISAIAANPSEFAALLSDFGLDVSGFVTTDITVTPAAFTGYP